MPDLLVISDMCFCEYTDHGHCGILDGCEVDNDLTVDLLPVDPSLTVLDIGAGPGFDAKRLALRVGRVTALEFSPILAEAGLASFPDLRWIGGFSHALYQAFQEFKQALDTFITEQVNPDIIRFIAAEEEKVRDAVEGIAPAVAIEQKNPTRTSRSTVGTATEVHDYLRLLWARIGHPHCHNCGAPIAGQSVEQIERDMDRDRFMSAEEAKAYGLVDDVLESRKVTEGE